MGIIGITVEISQETDIGLNIFIGFRVNTSMVIKLPWFHYNPNIWLQLTCKLRRFQYQPNIE